MLFCKKKCTVYGDHTKDTYVYQIEPYVIYIAFEFAYKIVTVFVA